MEKEVKYTIRLPQEIHQQIEKSAKDNRRSLNNEMLTIFDKFIKEAKEIALADQASESLTNDESILLDKIKNLPLNEQKAFMKKILNLSTGD